MKKIDSLKYYLEQRAFGVCSWLGQKIGIKSERVRLYFLYLSFGTLGSSIILYLLLAFWLNIKNYIKEGRRTTWDL
ncbi:MAG: PspC family transcriptional regulator [Flavobacteriales bacterium]|nr:PspC family transcriptional regulator [Flavobacteriales bacterium]